MVNPASDFGKFLQGRPGQPMPPGYGGGPNIPTLGQRDPRADPRMEILGQCPMGCKFTPVHFTPPGLEQAVPELRGKNLMARCMGCLCRWEADPSARLVNVRPFEQQVAEAMIGIQKRMQGANTATSRGTSPDTASGQMKEK